MIRRLILFLVFLSFFDVRAQIDSSATAIEVYIIDSYVTPELPYRFILSFFTSDSCKSVLVLNESEKFVVADRLTDNHKIEVLLTGESAKGRTITYKLILEDAYGYKSESQLYEDEIPRNNELPASQSANILQVCCFGGIIFGLPSPTYVRLDDKNYFGLSKEIPVFSFYSHGYNYPFGYIGIEYSHIFEAARQNYLRAGYKQLFVVDYIKYISVGLNYFTDFKGFSGISPEFSVGLFQVQNVFTFYFRYRYNFQPNKPENRFSEFSIGLYSNFFSLNL